MGRVSTRFPARTGKTLCLSVLQTDDDDDDEDDFQHPPSSVKKTPPPRQVKRRVKKVKEKRFRASTASEVGSEFLAEQVFHCLKCGQETKLTRSAVVNHLRRHRLSLQEYLDRFDTPTNQTRLGKVRLWVQEEEYLSRISGQRFSFYSIFSNSFLFRSRREKKKQEW